MNMVERRQIGVGQNRHRARCQYFEKNKRGRLTASIHKM
jgi:hypothetical protein